MTSSKFVKVFVTGGAGFIGSFLVESLLNKGNKVTVFDDFSNSSEEQASILANKGATIIKGDIRNFEFLKKHLIGFDTVIHLAAKIDVNESIKYPEVTNEVNVTGSQNLLKACVDNKIKNIIGISSAAVFGIPKKLPLSEDSETIPLSPYGSSKLTMEHDFCDYSNSHDLNSIILRIFNVYGPGQTDAYAGVITKFLKNISQNTPLLIFGDGSFTRDFISVQDVVSAINNSIDNLDKKKAEIYNIASGKHTSIKEIADLMVSISGKNLEIKYEPEKKGDIPHSQTLIDKAKKELGFSPSVNLKDGLTKLF